MQGVGVRIAAVVHQIAQREERSDQHLLVVLAGIGAVRVVREVRRSSLGDVFLFEEVEAVADLAQRPLGGGRFSGRQFDHRPFEFEDVRFFGPTLLGQFFVDELLSRDEIAGMKLGADVSQTIGIARATTGNQQHQTQEQAGQ